MQDMLPCGTSELTWLSYLLCAVLTIYAHAVTGHTYLIFCLAFNLFGYLRYGMPAIALTGPDKAGEVSPVPVAEALLQQLIPLLQLLLRKGLGVPWLSSHLHIVDCDNVTWHDTS